MGRDIRTAHAIDTFLKGLVITGMAGTIIVAPNAVQLGDAALKYLDKRAREKKSRQIIDYMARKQLIDYKELADGSLEVVITKQGKARVERIKFEDLTIPIPEKWDKKWHMVLFDVPEKRRAARRALSYKLRMLGLYQLQKSAWIFPYPCSVEVELVRQVFGLGTKDIVMVEISKLDGEHNLMKRFKLHD